MINKDKDIFSGSYMFSLSNSQAQQTLPEYIEERDTRGWVKYGNDNIYPDYISSLINMSSIHNKSIVLKTDMISGGGIISDKLDIKLRSFIENFYNIDGNLNEVLYKISGDLVTFGAFALEIIWNDKGDNISIINHIPVSNIRLSWKDEDKVYYCSDWSRVDNSGYGSNEKVEFEEIYKFDPSNRTGKQILYYKEALPGNKSVYGKPDYISAINYIELDYAISLFHNTDVKNGFAPSCVIKMKIGNNMTNEGRDDLVRQLKSQYSGPLRAGEPLIIFDAEETDTTIETYNTNNSDEKFIVLSNHIKENLLISHSISHPSILGMQQPGKLGSSSELLEALAIFQATYINKKQNILQNILSKLARYNGITEDIKIDKYKIDFDNIDSGNINRNIDENKE